MKDQQTAIQRSIQSGVGKRSATASCQYHLR